MADRPAHDLIVPVPFPEGVAAPDGTRGFVELRTAGILAIDLRTGDDLWSSASHARPRLVVGDRLVAEDRAKSRDNLLQFLTIQIEGDGRLDRELDPVVLPDWVAVGDPDHPFEYDVWAENSELVVRWRAESFYSGGAPPPAHLEARARRDAGGVARLDLGTGRLVTAASGRDHTGGTTIGDEAAQRVTTNANAPAIATLLPADARSASIVGGRLFYLRDAGLQLVCADPRTGEMKWTRSLPDRRAMRPPARRQ